MSHIVAGLVIFILDFMLPNYNSFGNTTMIMEILLYQQHYLIILQRHLRIQMCMDISK